MSDDVQSKAGDCGFDDVQDKAGGCGSDEVQGKAGESGSDDVQGKQVRVCLTMCKVTHVSVGLTTRV